jgi:hypothetical protein
MPPSICTLVDQQGRRVADVDLQGVEKEWFYGQIVSDAIPEDLRRDLEWYDEVVSNQMLSFLDDSSAAVERHDLFVVFPDQPRRKVYSLHVSRSGETTFRVTPAPPSTVNHSDSSAVPR